jgi:hypothetical protein
LHAAALSSDGTRAARIASDKIEILDTKSGNVVASHNYGGAPVNLAFGPDAKWLFSAETDGTVRLLQIGEGQPEHTSFKFKKQETLGNGTVELEPLNKSVYDYGQRIVPKSMEFSSKGTGLLLIVTNWGTWVCDFNWPAKALELEPKAAAARHALDTNSTDSNALRIIGEWLALNGANRSAVVFFEQAKSAGATVDSFLLGCCYLSVASRGPSAATHTRNEYEQWPSQKRALLSKAKAAFEFALNAGKSNEERRGVELYLRVIQSAISTD